MGNSSKAGVYCRLATADETGVMLCVERVCGFAASLGYKNPAVYFDNGKNGLDFDRPELLRLKADVDNGVIDTIITTRIDRIGRDIHKAMECIKRLESKGAKVIFSY